MAAEFDLANFSILYRGWQKYMSIELKALMFDTQSIQRYIFSGNRLRTNIGASYIVAKIFEEDLIEVLKKKFPNGVLQFTNKKSFLRMAYR